MTDEFDFYSRDETEPTQETGVFGSGFTLEELAARPGPWKEMADELILAKAEREAKAVKERLAAEAAAAAESGYEALSPERLEALLTVQAEVERATGDAAYLAAREADIRAAYPDREQAELKLAEEADALALVNEFMRAPGPIDVVAYREHLEAVAATERAEVKARDMLLRERTLEDDARDAEAYVKAALEAAAGVGS
jgi:hypothetical protein